MKELNEELLTLILEQTSLAENMQNSSTVQYINEHLKYRLTEMYGNFEHSRCVGCSYIYKNVGVKIDCKNMAGKTSEGMKWVISLLKPENKC